MMIIRVDVEVNEVGGEDGGEQGGVVELLEMVRLGMTKE